MEIKCPKMALHAPERELLSGCGLPLLLDPHSAAPRFLSTVVPALMLTPQAPIHSSRLWCFLPMDGKSAAMCETFVHEYNLSAILEEWRESPEYFAARHFGWSPRRGEEPKMKPQPKELSDDDLNFDF